MSTLPPRKAKLHPLVAEVSLQAADGKVHQGRASAIIRYSGASRSGCTVRLSAPGVEVEGHGDDCFDAFLQAREQIEPLGWRVLCYGASRNVWPSGMGRDMGDGLWAYRTTLGAPTALADRVGIFDYGDDMNVDTVASQRSFHEAWLESLGLTPRGLWRGLLRKLGF